MIVTVSIVLSKYFDYIVDYSSDLNLHIVAVPDYGYDCKFTWICFTFWRRHILFEHETHS